MEFRYESWRKDIYSSVLSIITRKRSSIVGPYLSVLTYGVRQVKEDRFKALGNLDVNPLYP